MAWTYSDYVTYDYGSTRLSRFRSHIQEVSDVISAEMSSGSDSYAASNRRAYLESLRKAESREIAASNAASASAPVFLRGSAKF